METSNNFASGSQGQTRTGITDTSLNVSVVVLSTLRDVERLPPVPGIKDAASIAVAIAEGMQKARNSRSGLNSLVEDSMELVYAIIHAHKNVTREEDVPNDLKDNLQQLIATLTSIQKFAEKSASRNFLGALLRINEDASKIQVYRGNLQQFLKLFGVQSEISLRDVVRKLVAQQVKVTEGLNNHGSVSVYSGDKFGPPFNAVSK